VSPALVTTTVSFNVATAFIVREAKVAGGSIVWSCGHDYVERFFDFVHFRKTRSEPHHHFCHAKEGSIDQPAFNSLVQNNVLPIF